MTKHARRWLRLKRFFEKGCYRGDCLERTEKGERLRGRRCAGGWLLSFGNKGRGGVGQQESGCRVVRCGNNDLKKVFSLLFKEKEYLCIAKSHRCGCAMVYSVTRCALGKCVVLFLFMNFGPFLMPIKR